MPGRMQKLLHHSRKKFVKIALTTIEKKQEKPAAAASGASVADELPLLRAMVFHAANSEICVATYARGAEAVFVESHHPLQAADLRQIRQKIWSRARSLHWKIAEPEAIEVWINGKQMRHVRTARHRRRLRCIDLIDGHLAEGQEFVLCGAGYDSHLEPAFYQLLRELSDEPEPTIQRLRSETLRQREDYELLLSHMIDGVILCDENLHVQFMNERARKLSGMLERLPRGAVLGATPLCDLGGLLVEAIETGIAQLNRVIPLGGDRSRLLGVHVQNVKNLHERSIGWLLILRDITASWQSDHMRSIVAVASHELNTPLASIRNTVDLLLDGEVGGLNESQQKYLKIINDDVVRLQRLLHDLLDLSKLDEKKLALDRRRHVRIEFVVNKVVELYTALAESKGIALKTKIPAGLPGITGDRDQLTQILVNLVDNAIKYSDYDDEVVIAASEEEEHLVISVTDHGAGIPESAREVIFQRFVQLENLPSGSHRGFGLGLSIAKEIVESHCGAIWVETKEGQGSTFSFSIPKHVAQKADQTPKNC